MTNPRTGAFLLLCAFLAACSSKAALPAGETPAAGAPAPFRDEVLRLEFTPPGTLERISTADENSAIFLVDGKRKLSLIRRYSTHTFADFTKDFESRVLAPMEESGQASRFEIEKPAYREDSAKIYGLRGRDKPEGQNGVSFILLAQRGKTFVISAMEGYAESERPELEDKARLIAGSLKVEDAARLFTDAETDSLKACKIVVRMGFGALRHDVTGVLRTCIGLNPYFDAYYSSLAEALRIAGREADALRVLDEGLQMFPNNATLINNEAWYLLTVENRELRNYGRALELSRRAVELTSRQSPALLHTLAQAYVETGDITEALRVLEECKKLSPVDPETLKSIRDLELRILRMRT